MGDVRRSLPCGHRTSGAQSLHASLLVIFGHVQHVISATNQVRYSNDYE